MSDNNKLKMLVVCLEQFNKDDINNFLNDKTISIKFSEKNKVSEISKDEVSQFDAIALATELSDQLTILIRNNPNHQPENLERV